MADPAPPPPPDDPPPPPADDGIAIESDDGLEVTDSDLDATEVEVVVEHLDHSEATILLDLPDGQTVATTGEDPILYVLLGARRRRVRAASPGCYPFSPFFFAQYRIPDVVICLWSLLSQFFALKQRVLPLALSGRSHIVALLAAVALSSVFFFFDSTEPIPHSAHPNQAGRRRSTSGRRPTSRWRSGCGRSTRRSRATRRWSA